MNFVEYETLVSAYKEAIKLNRNGKYSVVILFEKDKKVFYVLYSDDFERLKEEKKIEKVVIKDIIKGSESRDNGSEESEKSVEGGGMNENFGESRIFEKSSDDYISVDKFRNILFLIKSKNMSINDLREKLFEIEDPKADIEDVIEKL